MSVNVNTCATLVNVQVAMESAWADNAKNKDYIAEVNVAKAIIENQTVRIAELENPLKDKTVTVYWPEFCSPSTTAKTDDCSTAGSKPGTSCQDYTLSLGREIQFAVSEKTYRSIATNFEDAVAASMLASMKTLDEWVATQFTNKLVSSKGVNALTTGKGTVSGFSTSIAPAYWNATLFPYLKQVAIKNKFNAPFLISGSNLFEAHEIAMAYAANSDGKGAASLFNQMPIYFDLFNIDSILTPDAATFMVNKNALAFHSKVYYPNTISTATGNADGNVGARYSIPSKNIPGLMYDVIYRTTCSSNEITHNWQIQFTGDIFRNPVGCNPNNTNVLEFICA